MDGLEGEAILITPPFDFGFAFWDQCVLPFVVCEEHDCVNTVMILKYDLCNTTYNWLIEYSIYNLVALLRKKIRKKFGDQETRVRTICLRFQHIVVAIYNLSVAQFNCELHCTVTVRQNYLSGFNTY